MAGVTAMETRLAGVTFSVVELLTEPDVAVTPVLPTATAVAIPCALTVAMLVLAVLHVTLEVRSCVLPSV